jgi:glucose-6-phosphate 1-dehydrogenase
VARLRRPPATNTSEPDNPQNYVRFRISPETTIAMSVSITSTSGPGPRQAIELIATRHPPRTEMEPYERVLTEAIAGDPNIFARQDYVEQAWRIVDPVLKAATPVHVYEPHTWGPQDTASQVVPPGGWAVPLTDEQEDFHLVESAIHGDGVHGQPGQPSPAVPV